MEPKNVEFLRNKYDKAEFVYYTWDSIKNFPQIESIYKLFDRSYSFDKQDTDLILHYQVMNLLSYDSFLTLQCQMSSKMLHQK